MASYYDDNIVPMVDDLYDQILPLYTELHAYVRDKLWKYYGEQSFDPNGPIPAHILGKFRQSEKSRKKRNIYIYIYIYIYISN